MIKGCQTPWYILYHHTIQSKTTFIASAPEVKCSSIDFSTHPTLTPAIDDIPYSGKFGGDKVWQIWRMTSHSN